MSVAVFVSGTGSILEAILEGDVPVGLVLADRPCRGLSVARNYGLDTALIVRSEYPDRERYSDALADCVVDHGATQIALAGFQTIIVGRIHERFRHRMLNTHPSLLPAFPGWRAVEQALAAGVLVTGTTVHVVVPEVDAGPILAQCPVLIRRNDTADILHERIKVVERVLYPRVLRAMVLASTVTLNKPWWEGKTFVDYMEREEDECEH
ncbi:MAG: phosphoribosylglycinamide formyltransferase [Ferrimicrobium sp.]